MPGSEEWWGGCGSRPPRINRSRALRDPPAVLLTGLEFPAGVRTQLVMPTAASGGARTSSRGMSIPGDDRGLTQGHGLLDLGCQFGVLPHEPPPPGVPDVVPPHGGPPDVEATLATAPQGRDRPRGARSVGAGTPGGRGRVGDGAWTGPPLVQSRVNHHHHLDPRCGTQRPGPPRRGGNDAVKHHADRPESHPRKGRPGTPHRPRATASASPTATLTR